MNSFLLHLLLAFVWALFAGDFSLRQMLIGYLLGGLILYLFPRALGSQGYLGRSRAVLDFVWYFLREVTVANVQVALFALAPQPPLHSMIVTYPVRLRGDGACTLFAAVMGLMPGTVAMGFDERRKHVYVHVIGIPSLKDAHASIRKVEDKLLPLFGQEAR